MAKIDIIQPLAHVLAVHGISDLEDCHYLMVQPLIMSIYITLENNTFYVR